MKGNGTNFKKEEKKTSSFIFLEMEKKMKLSSYKLISIEKVFTFQT
jgi:hypothetical protein